MGNGPVANSVAEWLAKVKNSVVARCDITSGTGVARRKTRRACCVCGAERAYVAAHAIGVASGDCYQPAPVLALYDVRGREHCVRAYQRAGA